MAELREMLDETIKLQLDRLCETECNTTEQIDIAGTISTLYKLRIEEDKVANDSLEKSLSNKTDARLKSQEIEEQRKDRYVKLALAGIELLIPIMAYGYWFNKGLKFEETGVFTSSTMRNLIGKFKPTKK